MIYKPKRENRAYIVIPAILLICSALCFVFSRNGGAFPVILQTISMSTLIGAVLVISRYSLCEYCYLIGEESSTDFIIRKIQYKRSTEVCRISLPQIKRIDKKEAKFNYTERYGKVERIYNFCTNMFPRNAYCMLLECDGESIVIIIEATEELIKEIRLRASI